MNMKTPQSRRQTAKVSHSRWLAYATASAATALAGSHSAEAAIHYSGILNGIFPPHRDKIHTFPLDQAGDSLVFQRKEVGTAFFQRTDIDYFRVDGIASADFWAGPGTYGGYTQYVSKLLPGQNVSSGQFRSRFGVYGAIMVFGDREFYNNSPWLDPGVGFVGFKFNNGAGIPEGWVRVRMGRPPEQPFGVVS